MAFQMTLGEAKEALSRAKNAMGRVREKAEEAIGSGIEVAEVGGTAFGFGYANGRWGGDDGEVKMFGLPVDLGVGIALTGVAMFGGFGKYGEHGVNHRGGFLLMYKRLEKGRFRIPTIAPGTRTAMLDATELAMLLDGIDVTRVKRSALWEPPSIAR